MIIFLYDRNVWLFVRQKRAVNYDVFLIYLRLVINESVILHTTCYYDDLVGS